MLGPSNLGQSMQKMTLPMGTMSKAMASMTMTMRRAGAGLGTMRPMVESNDSGRLAGIAPDVATAGESLPTTSPVMTASEKNLG